MKENGLFCSNMFVLVLCTLVSMVSAHTQNHVPSLPISLAYILCTFELRVHFLKVFPWYQKMIPQKHHKVINDIFVIIGGMYPDLMIQGVMNFEKPYPQTFLLTVIATKIEPATGLYESMAYVDEIAGSAATWMPAQV
jgi:hypothetical protein